MATVPAPRTWTVGELLTASKLNTDLRDGLNFLLTPPLTILTRSVSQSFANNAIDPVTWPVEVVDRDGGHSTSSNTSRYTAATAGYYTLHAFIEWDVTSTTGFRRIMFRTNGATFTHQDSRSSPPTRPIPHLSGIVFLAVNDYVEVTGDQSGGTTIGVFQGRWDILWTST